MSVTLPTELPTADEDVTNLSVDASLQTKASARSMTVDEFLALPDDPAVDRELIYGQLKEQPMTVRGRRHAKTEGRIVQRLNNFFDRADVAIEAASGEAGVILEASQSSVGVDVVCCTSELLSSQDGSTRLIRGVPLLAVEILSESDTFGDVVAKVQLYLDAGVPLVWVADPVHQSIAAYVRDRTVKNYSGEDVITPYPAFEGFSLPVRQLFER